MSTIIGIFGIQGKMGKAVSSAAALDPSIKLFGGTSRFSDKREVLDLARNCDVLIDFSSLEALEVHLEAAILAKKPLVIGITGLKETDFKKIHTSSAKIPILHSPNFSIGMALCRKLVRETAHVFAGKNVHIDIIEAHHKQKKDAPSGSALALAQATGLPSIPIHSIRAAKIIGEHAVQFNTDEERIEIKHEVHSRDAFAKGALTAAKFLRSQKEGLYSIDDVL